MTDPDSECSHSFSQKPLTAFYSDRLSFFIVWQKLGCAHRLKMGFLVRAMLPISPLSAPTVVHTVLQCGLFIRHAPTYAQHTICTTSRQPCRDELGLRLMDPDYLVQNMFGGELENTSLHIPIFLLKGRELLVYLLQVSSLDTTAGVEMCVHAHMCTVISEQSVILFETQLTFVTFLIENDEPERFVVALSPQRAPQVQKTS